MTEQQERIAIGLAGILAAVCAVLPWVTATTVFGSVSRNGIDQGGDGLITAGAGVVVALLALGVWERGRAVRWLVVVAGLVVTGIGIMDFADVQDRISELEDEADGYATGSTGIGLYGTILAGLAILALGLYTLRTRPAPATEPGPVQPELG
jgi:hypothetical protein